MLTGTCIVGERTARWAFTDRRGGVSRQPYDKLNLAGHVGDDALAVRANRVTLEQVFAAGSLSWMGPVHGTDLATLDEPVALTPNVDALATIHARTPLVALGADCVPLLVAAGDLVIAAHIGWQGFADGMTDVLVSALHDRGIDVATAQVLLGPAICGACYGIPDDRAERIAARSAAAITRARSGDVGADIRVGLAAEWRTFGAAVSVIGPCTYEHAGYFSHRREGVTGRQGGVIAWAE